MIRYGPFSDLRQCFGRELLPQVRGPAASIGHARLLHLSQPAPATSLRGACTLCWCLTLLAPVLVIFMMNGSTHQTAHSRSSKSTCILDSLRSAVQAWFLGTSCRFATASPTMVCWSLSGAGWCMRLQDLALRFQL